VKDKKYRGKTTSRKDLFDDLEMTDGFRGEQEETSEDEEGQVDEEKELSDVDMAFTSESSSGSDESDASSDAEEEDEENEEDDDQSNRRDKVRQLLAQETK
jgi:protein AATF/BFR2